MKPCTTPHSKPLRALVAAVGLLILAYTAVIQSTANADTFTPANSAPTVSSPSLSASIQPDAGASDTQYSYAITVGDADTLNDLSTVIVYLYHQTAGDSTCATPDPATDVKLVWTQSTTAFTVDDGAGAYWANGASPAPSSPTLTGTSGTFTFTFVVSEAAREGTWVAAATADDGGATASDSTATTAVAHYAGITTRTQRSFGTLEANTAGTVTDSPTVTSNGPTAYSLTAGDFTDGTYTFTLKTTGAPSTDTSRATGEVSYDCNQDSVFDGASATRVASTATQVGSAITSTGTAEGGVTQADACRLLHGRGRPVSTYSFTVVNTVSNG